MDISANRTAELTSLGRNFERLRVRLDGLTDDDTLREERNWRWLDREPVLFDADIRQPPTANDAIHYVRRSHHG